MLFGGEIVRLFHGDECLTVPEPEQDDVTPAIGNYITAGKPMAGMIFPGEMSFQGPGGPQSGQSCPPEPVNIRDSVMYEIGSVESQARSLWYIEHTKFKWSGGFLSWDCSIRLRHVTTGRYLGVITYDEAVHQVGSDPFHVVTIAPEDATEQSCLFYIKKSKDEKKKNEEREQDGMGNPDLCIGETLIYLQHVTTNRWLSYESYETKLKGVGRVEQKKAVLLVEGHMDDVFTVCRSQEEEQKSANAIRRTTGIFNSFNASLDDVIKCQTQASLEGIAPLLPNLSGKIPVDEMVQCLEDLNSFFIQPEMHEDHEAKQARLTALKNRQDLFQQEGIIGLVLSTIDRFTASFSTRRDFAQVCGEDRVGDFEKLLNLLYLFLAALIRGNRENCAQFAAPHRLDWLFNRLQLQQSVAEGVIDTLHCVLTDSDEALNLITPNHIRTLISLLDKQGRDPQVLQVLCSLCLGRQGCAVRLNQDLIYDTLIPERDLLLQTKLVDECCCIRPNIFVGIKEGGNMYSKWYFEVQIDEINDASHEPVEFRVGWANTEGFEAFPAGGSRWGSVHLGDDLFSYAFDGNSLWFGGKPKMVHFQAPPPVELMRPASPTTVQSDEQSLNSPGSTNLNDNLSQQIAPPQPPPSIPFKLKKGDVVGCLLDLAGPVIQFNVNGNLVKGYFQDFNATGLFYPCLSTTAKSGARFLLGGNQGRLRYGPPMGYSPIYEARMANIRLKLEPVFNFGNLDKSVFSGPSNSPTDAQMVFVPQTIVTAGVQLSSYVEGIRDKLAENIHEMWTLRKIEQGWKQSDRRDDTKMLHPCLTSFNNLPPSEKQYDITLAYETLRTIVGLGFSITYDINQENTRIKTIKVPMSYTQTNGYRPQPLDLSSVRLSQKLENLVSQLAENTHNMWARDRIAQGWTYGLTEDSTIKRSPHLVQFLEVDPFIRRSNRETAIETVKTLLAYGFVIEPLSTDIGDSTRIHSSVQTVEKGIRTYRVQKNRGVNQGKWYYELELLTSGHVRVGWADIETPPQLAIGSHKTSFAFSAFEAQKWNRTGTTFGKVCHVGDVIGCMIDFNDGTITFSLNGELMMDPLGQEIAFKNVTNGQTFVPAFSLGPGQQVKLNFGNDVQLLRFFTYIGLQEGYSPFCVNMVRPAPLWFAKEDPSLFLPIGDNHRNLEVEPSLGSVPNLKLICKNAGSQGEQPLLEFIKLSLGVKCRKEFTKISLQDRRNFVENMRKTLEPELYYDSNMGQVMDPSGFGLMNPDMVNSTLGMNNAGKKKKLPNLFKKNRPNRDQSPEVLSALAGDSLASVGMSGNASASGVYMGPPSAVQNGPPAKHKHLGANTSQLKILGGKDKEAASAITGGSGSGGAGSGGISGTGEGIGQANKKNVPTVEEINKPIYAERENAIAQFIDEFSFNILVLPGQEPGHVHIGWITSNFKLSKPALNQTLSQTSTTDNTPQTNAISSSSNANVKGNNNAGVSIEQIEVRQAAVCLLEDDLTLKSAVAERSSFMINVGEILNKMANAEDLGKRMSQGLLISCWVDTAMGTLGFEMNGRETGIRYQVEPGTKLFAAVFVRPTARETLQFDFGRRSRFSLPITSGMLRPPKQVLTSLPNRLKVEALQRVHWARLPPVQLKPHTMKMSDARGWSVLLEDPVSQIMIKVPETDRSISLSELDEFPALLKFHSNTLILYQAICCHGNHNVAQQLIQHIDVHQLLQAIQSQSIPGLIRSGLADLIRTISLATHVKLKSVTSKEILVPLDPNKNVNEHETKFEKLMKAFKMDLNYIPAIDEHISIIPHLKREPHLLIPGADGTGEIAVPNHALNESEEVQLNAALQAAGPGGLLKIAECPEFPLDKLKMICLKTLVLATNIGGQCRDPLGGTFEHMILPILKIVNDLLVMGSIRSDELRTILAVLDPKVFYNEKPIYDLNNIPISIFELPLPESVKIELCYLFHNLCDLKHRHIIENLVEFADGFMQEVQNAAKLTREFRCPPLEQMKCLLRMPGLGGPTLTWNLDENGQPIQPEGEGVDEEEEVPLNPCADEIKDIIRAFHRRLMKNFKVIRPDNYITEEDPFSKFDNIETLINHEKMFRGENQLMTIEPNQQRNYGHGSSVEEIFGNNSINEILNKIDEMTNLEQLPSHIGDPEIGNGGPPQLLTALWSVFKKRPSDSMETEKRSPVKDEESDDAKTHSLSYVILRTMVNWARCGPIESLPLVKEMFSLMYRQYSQLEELSNSLQKTYVISVKSKDCVARMVRSLGRIRSLLGVQLGPNEEILLRNCCWDIMNNKIFFQHPNLTRTLAVHETVMQLMVQTLAKANLDQQDQQAMSQDSGDNFMMNRGNEMQQSQQQQQQQQQQSQQLQNNQDNGILQQNQSKISSTDMVTQCCRFLCFFCRISRSNQKAMFEHLSYMLEKSSMLLARPSLRGTCPLDVACSSLKDNNELALALREKQLEKVAVYLSRCGVQSNAELVSKGYPDIGWDPVEGERFLDFLRYTVWVNGESVEENANLVVRLLIRRPECLGPALKGGSKKSKVPKDLPLTVDTQDGQAPLAGEEDISSTGGGLLQAMKQGLVMSAQIKLIKMAMEAEAAGLNPDDEDLGWKTVLSDYEDANLFVPMPYDFSKLPVGQGEENPDFVDLGAAILQFYSVLVNLLGRCAADSETTKSESLRAKTILQSLVSMNDLEGVISLKFILPPPKIESHIKEDGTEEWVDKAGMPPGLLPEHKSSVVLFMERVYGIQEAETFLRLLENGFLPDLRAATLLDSAQVPDSDMALALNRYLCNAVLPLLTKYAHFLKHNESAVGLLEATLHTTYRLSKCQCITNKQRDAVRDLLIALVRVLEPPTMTKLLKKIAIDVKNLNKDSVVALQVLTEFYHRCGSYYSSEGWSGDITTTNDDSGGSGTASGSSGIVKSATEDDRGITAQLFTSIFDSLAKQPYEPALFSYALPCLCAIGCALPPEYSLTNKNKNADGDGLIPNENQDASAPGGPPVQVNDDVLEIFRPKPVDTSQIRIPNTLSILVDNFAEHCHDTWAQELFEQGYICGAVADEFHKTHPNLKHFRALPQNDQMKYIHPVTNNLKTMIALGWSIDAADARHEGNEKRSRRKMTVQVDQQKSYTPSPKDLSSVNVTKEMCDLAEKLADNAHNIWAKQKMDELDSIGGGVHQLLVPFEILTDRERRRYRRLTHDLIKYLQFHGYRLNYNSSCSGSGTATGDENQAEQRADAANPNNKTPSSNQAQSKRIVTKRNHPSTRFAYELLRKLLEYVECAMSTVHELMPCQQFSKNRFLVKSSADMKFFVKVVLPLVDKYFDKHNSYFTNVSSGASIEEKKMSLTLFCKLFTLLRLKMNAYGHEVNISVSCLQCLVQTIDVKAIIKIQMVEDFIRVRLLPFFINCADDLTLIVKNLSLKRYSHLKGTIKRGACSLDYMHMILLPVLKSLFEHISKTNCSDELIVGSVQIACYKILNALYYIGTCANDHRSRKSMIHELNRHRPLLGECLATLASCFPVAFLEPDLNENNPLSISYNNQEGDYGLEARDVLNELAKTLQPLDKIIEQVEMLAESGSAKEEDLHLIEITLPMLCSYLPVWWRKNADQNVSNRIVELARVKSSSTDMPLALVQSKPEDKVKGSVLKQNEPITTVTSDLMNKVLGSVLKLIQDNLDSPNAPWMTRIATRTQPIVAYSTSEMLGLYFLPVSQRLLEHAQIVEKCEETYKLEKKACSENLNEFEEELADLVEVLVRNIFAFFPLLIKFVDRHRNSWLKKPTQETEKLFMAISKMFLCWSKSEKWKREEDNFASAHELDQLAMIMPGGDASLAAKNSGKKESDEKKEKEKKQPAPNKPQNNSLTLACIKRLLPVGLSQLGGREQELVQRMSKVLMQYDVDSDLEHYLKFSLDQEKSTDTTGPQWQKLLYDKIDANITSTKRLENLESSLTKEYVISKILTLAKVMHCQYLVDHPPAVSKAGIKRLVSHQRKRAVMACFRMIPLYALPRHKVVNVFLSGYVDEWLDFEESPGVRLIEDLAAEDDASEEKELEKTQNDESRVESNPDDDGNSENHHEIEKPLNMKTIAMINNLASNDSLDEGEKVDQTQTIVYNETDDNTPENTGEIIDLADPLRQLIQAFCRTANEQDIDDPVYLAYAKIMAKSCHAEEDDEEEEEEDEEEAGEESNAQQEQEEQKQQLLSEQRRLAERGAAEMTLLQLAASKGESTPVAQKTIELGIALLLGGNIDVQRRMLDFLKDKKLNDFFISMAGLMEQCSVLDLDTVERCNKAEGLAVGLSDMEGITNLYDAESTCKIFRFLQLLCEGHNLDFQDYLRSQSDSTVSVNLIISTVDYLLRLQESIMDFYWHYSNKDIIDQSGKTNFIKAIKIGKQVFCTLTEYIQGPCQGNQLALAHSRLWDAIGGFLYLFAHMQNKLSRDADQLDLLREFLNLQKEMMIMLLSMLEGNVVNGPIALQMVDTLAESSTNVEMILKFFDIFLRMRVITSSDAFLAFDVNGDGWISNREFRTALEQQKTYSDDEIAYIMACVDSNADGKVDFNEFTDRFYNPAKDIGFNVAVLLTNLSQHITNDNRLERILEKARGVLETFEPYLGCIEICRGAKSIERVYFEIKQQHIDQWNAPQIKESKQSFLHAAVGESGDKEKLECFVNFCEDTIFEMQHAQAISGNAEESSILRVHAVRSLIKATGLGKLYEFMAWILNLLHPSSITYGYRKARSVTFDNLIIGLMGLQIGLIIGGIRFVLGILKFAYHLIYEIASGKNTPKPPIDLNNELKESLRKVHGIDNIANPNSPSYYTIGEGSNGDPGEWQNALQGYKTWLLPEDRQLVLERVDPSAYTAKLTQNLKETQDRINDQDELKKSKKLSSKVMKKLEDSYQPKGKSQGDEIVPIDTSTYLISFFSHNFYRFKMCALVLAFFINFLLLFYKVERMEKDDLEDNEELITKISEAISDAMTPDGDADDDDEDKFIEWVTLADKANYIGPLFLIFAFMHTVFSFSALIAYYYLKVPLVIFKREKEISRKLEFEGMWIVEQPKDEDIGAHWDKLVLSTPSFPAMYWEKFVKKKVINKYSDQYNPEEIKNLLGVDQQAQTTSGFLFNLSVKIDFQYSIWKWGVIFMDKPFLYLVVYFIISLAGNWNYFCFAFHLVDIAVSFKTLRTILQSVTHNGKQVVLTVMMTSVVVYLYTVVAFNFFRKFYVQDGEEEGEKDFKCLDMMTCFIFHFHTGLRAGGGIADEIESPEGDPSEFARIVFDVTFFFFVIVILLNIVQGLIIDAFGELRDQMEQIRSDLESQCFICGIGKDYFDQEPHGFETHVEKEHNFANYLFFLMHIINKAETEYTGQETYVWELYQRRCWDFFPSGECFRKQNEDKL